MDPLAPIRAEDLPRLAASTKRLREHLLAGGSPDSNERAAHNKDSAMRLVAQKLEGNEAFAELGDCEQGEILLDVRLPALDGATDTERKVAALMKQWASGHHDSEPNWALLAAAEAELGAPMREDCWPADSSPFDEGEGSMTWWKQDPAHSALKAFVRAMYETTQEQLQSLGIDEVIASRGVRYNDAVERCPFTGGLKADDPDLNTLSAFSLDVSTALEFACPSNDDFEDFTSQSVLIGACIPASRIVCMPTSGLGSTWETELVVMSAEHGIDQVSAHCQIWPDGSPDRMRMPYQLDHLVAGPQLGSLSDASQAEPGHDRELGPGASGLSH